jgi:hypothetical protein
VAELNEGVTVRRLPEGEAHAGRLESREGQRLRVSLPHSAKGVGFQPGTPVEVQSEQVLYLGVVLLGTAPVRPDLDRPELDRPDPVLLISIEHTVDRTALAAIQEVWHGSSGE